MVVPKEGRILGFRCRHVQEQGLQHRVPQCRQCCRWQWMRSGQVKPTDILTSVPWARQGSWDPFISEVSLRHRGVTKSPFPFLPPALSHSGCARTMKKGHNMTQITFNSAASILLLQELSPSQRIYAGQRNQIKSTLFSPLCMSSHLG